MKKYILLAAIFTIFMASCEKNPYADFLVSSRSIEPGETIYFTNISDNSVEFEWDFGDGEFSTNTSPSHVYTQEGTFTVRLAAHSKKGESDVSSTTIEVYSIPVSDFSVPTTFFQPGDVVSFSNNSVNATSYLWDFGDGTTSTEKNPSHTFNQEDFYMVSLTIYADNGFSSNSQVELEIFYTALEITVAEWNSELVIDNLIIGANVRLYPTLKDWDDETNKVADGETDGNGQVVFTKLKTKSYFIEIFSPNYNNWTLRNDDPEFITTLPLEYARYNTFVAWVDYVPDALAGKSRKDFISLKSANEHRVYQRIGSGVKNRKKL